MAIWMIWKLGLTYGPKRRGKLRRDRSVLADRQFPQESWRGQQQPLLHSELEHWIAYYMGQSDKAFSRDLSVACLGELSRKEPANRRLLSAGSLFLRPVRKTGGLV